MKVAHLRFDSDLSALLMTYRGQPEVQLAFSGPQSVKHLIESLGIPHTEIGTLTVNGQAVDLNYQVLDGDEVVVTANADGGLSEAEPSFILDGHLGRLAAYLRMLGLDCLYPAQADDRELASVAVREDRVLLTRDRRLLMRKLIQRGYLVRSLIPPQQLREVVLRYQLRRWIRPFQRCLRCNGLLRSVPKEEVLDRLEPLTRQYFDDFRLCPDCGQVYWKGSHFERMSSIIAGLG